MQKNLILSPDCRSVSKEFSNERRWRARRADKGCWEVCSMSFEADPNLTPRGGPQGTQATFPGIYLPGILLLIK